MLAKPFGSSPPAAIREARCCTGRPALAPFISEDLFYEHVHFDPNGNYALALAWAREVEKQLAPALKRDARPAWISKSEFEQLLGLTDWNRLSILAEVLGRIQPPPFSGQSDNARQAARLWGEMDKPEAFRSKTGKVAGASLATRTISFSTVGRANQ